MTKFIPHEYQKVAIDFILDNPCCGLFLDMGLGKTVSTLTAIKELKYNYYDIEKVLVIAPKRVAIDTWPTEIEKWEHTKDLTYTMLTGPKKERQENLKKKVDIYITTRDLISWLVDEVGKHWSFDCLVIDELSSFKSSSSKRFKSLRKVRGLCKRVIGLTGTPKPNSYMDLWSQLYLLDGGERLGKYVSHYRKEYFNLQTWGGFPSYSLKPGTDKIITKKMSDICISMKSKDYLTLEEPTIIDKKIKLSPKEAKQYKQLEKDYLLTFPDGDEITAFNGAALNNKLLQLANGAVYDEDKNYKVIHNTKLDTLKEIAEEGENILVFYAFQSDKERILQAIPEAVSIDEEGAIANWKKGNIKMLVAHPASAGHGLNLQTGGHVIVWFGLNWSLELYQQANARLQRQGQTEPVIIYRLIAEGTQDERVAKVLESKDYSQEDLLQALKAKIKKVKSWTRRL